MQSIISFKHRWNNPLNRMKSSAVGLHPLPLELWEEIFSLATDADEYWEEIQGNRCTILNPFFTSREEDLLRDPMGWNGQGLLRTRHSIILVCKSWYFMGIPILWSHLQISEKDTRSVATMIYSALKRNPTLASHVVRLTIRPVDPHPTETRTPGRTQSITKILPLLRNMVALSCSMHVAAEFHPSFRPQIAVIYAREKEDIYSRHDFYVDKIVQPNYFWHNCRILSFTFTRRSWHCTNQESQIVFKNLMDLRLRIEHPAAIQWITDTWKLPVLKCLSLVATQDYEWIQLLTIVRLSIERLQIPRLIRASVPSDLIVMPNLKTLYLIGSEGSPWLGMSEWHHCFACPKLHKCVLLVDTMAISRGSDHSPAVPNAHLDDVLQSSVVTYLNAVRHLHKSIKEINLIIPSGKWVHPYEKEHRLVVLMRDVIKWRCEGLTVNIT